MTTLYILVDEATGKKFVQWKARHEAEDTIGDAMMELPKGNGFRGIPYADLKTGMTFEVEDDVQDDEED